MSTTPSSTPLSRRLGGVSDAVNETAVRAIVDGFYGVAWQDPMLGPVFESHATDWKAHLEKMYGFWATALRGERRYSGNPFAKHQAVPDLLGLLFERSLGLFAETVRSHCSAEDSEVWETTARRMGFAMSSRLGLGECHNRLSGV